MSNLTLTAKWHDTINQVETSEPITGGAEGNANLAPKQLAECQFCQQTTICQFFRAFIPTRLCLLVIG